MYVSLSLAPGFPRGSFLPVPASSRPTLSSMAATATSGFGYAVCQKEVLDFKELVF